MNNDYQIIQELSSILESENTGWLDVKWDNERVIGLAIFCKENLSELPNNICDLKQLNILSVDYCNLKCLPSAIGNLTKLEYLQLRGNNIKELPSSIQYLKELQDLDLSHNKFSVMPECIFSLTNIKTLALQNNELTYLPNQFNLILNLDIIDLSNNQLTSLPESFSSLKFSKQGCVSLSGNLFNSFPTNIPLNVKRLGLANLGLKTVPSLAQYTQLESLSLAGNKLSELPLDFDKLDKLTRLDLASNMFEYYPDILHEMSEYLTILLYDNPLKQEYYIRMYNWK